LLCESVSVGAETNPKRITKNLRPAQLLAGGF